MRKLFWNFIFAIYIPSTVNGQRFFRRLIYPRYYDDEYRNSFYHGSYFKDSITLFETEGLRSKSSCSQLSRSDCMFFHEAQKKCEECRSLISGEEVRKKAILLIISMSMVNKYT